MSQKKRQDDVPGYRIITAVLLYGGSFPEAYILANSLEQGKSRVFEIATRIIKASPLLRNECDITANKIFFPAFDAVIQALPSDAGSAAGTNAAVAGFDELWTYDSEAARRLWDELTPPPTRQIAFRLTTTYAGFENEASLLFELYKRGLEQPKIGEDLYAGDGLIMFWPQADRALAGRGLGSAHAARACVGLSTSLPQRVRQLGIAVHRHGQVG